MGLNVSLVGSNSKLYQDIRGTVEKILDEICYQNPDAKFFNVGSTKALNRVRLSEKIGSYRMLHLLRRYAAHLEIHGIPPSDPWRKTGDDPLLEQLYRNLVEVKTFPHFINHADNSGYYFPIDFPKPITIKDVPHFESSVGSSQQLLTELEKINLHLKMPTDFKINSDFYDLIGNDPWELEKEVWGILYYFTKKSVSHNLLLCFG